MLCARQFNVQPSKEMADSKLCPKCGARERHQGPNHLEPYCKPCRLEYTRNRNKQVRTERRAWMDDYKVKRGCCKCGYNAHPVALELNHIDPSNKEFTVSRMLGAGYQWEKILAEIDKCEVMCSNCHQIHTYENKHSVPKSLRGREN